MQTNKLISTNPAKNYEIVGEVEITSKQEIQQLAEKAKRAQKNWGALSVEERVEKLKPFLQVFEDRKSELVDLAVKEIGKPVEQARGDMDFDRDYLQWFFERASKALEPKVTFEDNETKHQLIYEPRGVVAVIAPWNFPFSNAIWGIIPNLLVGNTVIFKHSEECPLSGKLIEEMFAALDLIEGVFSEIYGGSEVGELLTDQAVDLIWFTGSSGAGQKIYEKAAQKGIPAILEMGGSNPGVVFEDVDVEKVIPQLFGGRFSNCGQVCDALKRLFVHESLINEVVEKLVNHIASKKLGDPTDETMEIGSLAAKRQLELLEEQVADAIEKGAKIVIGGKRPEGLEGAFYLPTVLTNVTRDMKVYKEEVFGPVLPVMPFSSEEEAIELANDTIYGLGASVWSADKERALRVAKQIQAGNVEVNGVSHFIPQNPFGGYKRSGLGREHGDMGFHELAQVKVISLRK